MTHRHIADPGGVQYVTVAKEVHQVGEIPADCRVGVRCRDETTVPRKVVVSLHFTTRDGKSPGQLDRVGSCTSATTWTCSASSPRPEVREHSECPTL